MWTMCKVNTESHNFTKNPDMSNKKNHVCLVLKETSRIQIQHRQKSPGRALGRTESTHTLLAQGNSQMRSKRRKHCLPGQSSPDTKPRSRPRPSARFCTRHKTGAPAGSSCFGRRAQRESNQIFSLAPTHLDLGKMEQRRATNHMTGRPKLDETSEHLEDGKLLPATDKETPGEKTRSPPLLLL